MNDRKRSILLSAYRTTHPMHHVSHHASLLKVVWR